jgi:hypothetical protein
MEKILAIFIAATTSVLQRNTNATYWPFFKEVSLNCSVKNI